VVEVVTDPSDLSAIFNAGFVDKGRRGVVWEAKVVFPKVQTPWGAQDDLRWE
jgi:hypothetical protein